MCPPPHYPMRAVWGSVSQAAARIPHAGGGMCRRVPRLPGGRALHILPPADMVRRSMPPHANDPVVRSLQARAHACAATPGSGVDAGLSHLCRAENADGKDMRTDVIIVGKDYKGRMVEKGERHERVPRWVYMQKDDFERWGARRVPHMHLDTQRHGAADAYRRLRGTGWT